MGQSEVYEPTNFEIAAMALMHLGGATSRVDLEDIAIEAHRLAPQKFSWKKYPNQIDISAVRYALKDAAGKNPALVAGGVKAGYMLTKDGLELAEGLEPIIDGLPIETAGRKGSIEADLEEERARLRASAGFVKYMRGEESEIGMRDFLQFVKINDYFPAALREKRFLKIENAVSSDRELAELWRYLKRIFLEGQE